MSYFLVTHIDVDAKRPALTYRWGGKKTKTEGWIRAGDISLWMYKNMRGLDRKAPIWGIGGNIKF